MKLKYCKFNESNKLAVIIMICTALAMLANILAITTTTDTAKAAIKAPMIHVTLLGDSYSAGNGAGSYYGNKDAYRSRNNWAHKYVDWLNKQGTPATLNNLAHSGYTTNDVMDKQIPDIDTNTNLVMFTIGGNDVDFGGIVSRCFVPPFREPKNCEGLVDRANSKLNEVKSHTLSILEKIDNHLPHEAQVVIVGYPRLASGKYTLIDNSGFRFGRPMIAYDAGTSVRKLSDASKKIQLDLISEWNRNHPQLKVTYIDGVISAFDGHEPTPFEVYGGSNPNRWINGLFETEGIKGADGRTQSKPSSDIQEYYHPNIIGHAEIANLIKDKIGVPKLNGGHGRDADIDIVFAIDSTGSMKNNVDAIRSKIDNITREVSKKSSSPRFALIDYKDHPQFNPNNQNYLAKTDLNFTSNISDLETALGSLNYEGGNIGNTNASVYSGVMQAVNMKWRNGVKKIVVVIGDAPPRDPEPGTDYTAASVAKAAYEVDPVSVYGIDTGHLNSTSFQTLVTSSTGTTANASSPDQVSDLVNKAISSELNKPFAWIQGPYVAKVEDPVDIDAAASHVVSGSLTSYEWDFNGDGVYDETGTSPRITHTFTEEFSGVIGLRVTQSDGQSAVATTQVDITNDGDNTPRDQDNCPDINNWGQTDYDNDGGGDQCDPDPGFPTQDKLGICVVGENCPPDIDASYKPTSSAQTNSAPQTARRPSSSHSGIKVVRVMALALLGLLTGAAVLHYRRKVTS